MRTAAASCPARAEAVRARPVPRSYGVRSGAEVTVEHLFPRAATARKPFDVTVGEHFDTLTMPRRVALEIISRYQWLRPHPVGAAMARALTDEWVLILPPGSGYGMQWSQPTRHSDEGVLKVPPLAAGPDDDLRWAREGNNTSRVFSAPFLLMFALRPARAACPPHPVPARDDRMPVGIR